MKKHLFTCFLASLCLYGSSLTAQVADSPGADFLHRSVPQLSPEQGDTHRGGDARPDTLPEDGSLVDHFGLPAGNRAVDRGVSDLKAGLPAAIGAGDLTVSDLKAGQGQESEGSSASEEPSSAVIWGMVSDYSGMEEVELRVFQDFFFDSPKAPLSNSLSVPLKNGNLMEGAYPKDKSFQYQLSGIEKPVWFSLSMKNALPFLNRFVIEPGDSVQVYADTQRLSVVFGGSDGDKFRLQYRLQQLQNEVNKEDDPILWTGNPDAVLADSSRRSSYLEALASAGPVLQVRDQKSEQLPYLQNFDPFAINGLLERSFDLIEGYRGILDDNFLELMRTEAELSVWVPHLSGIYSAMTYANRAGLSEMETGLKDLAALRLAEISESLIDQVSPSSSAMMELLDVQTKLLTASKEIGYREAIMEIPNKYWREKYLVRILYEKYQGLDEAEAILDDALADTRDPQNTQLLSTLKNLTGKGEPVRGFEFIGEAGESFGIDGLPDADIYLVEFWITGCKVCVAFNELTLSKVKERFAGDDRLQVITISADFEEEVWKNSLASGRYTQAGFTNLYTGSINRKHPFLLKYGISSFPNRILMDGEGKILQIAQVPFTAEQLIPLLENSLTDSLQAEPKP